MSWYTFFRYITFGIYSVPFCHDPDHFKIFVDQAYPTLKENEHVVIRYSANGGLSWRYIMCAYGPVLCGEKWVMDRLVFNVAQYPDFDMLFRSYDNVLNFEDCENQKVIEGNRKLTKEQLRRRKQIKDTLNQINSKNSEYRGTAL